MVVLHFRSFFPDRAYFLSSLASLWFLAGPLTVDAQTAEALPAWYRNCNQMVVVITEKWGSTEGRLRCLERGADRWEVAHDWIPVTVGRKGLGLGVGLHPRGLTGPEKQEGDKRAPAGIFRLESGFGALALVPSAFPYRQTTPDDFWVDDLKSRFYNQWVNITDPRVVRDWKSAEVLRRGDGLYDYAIVVGHNREPIVPGLGSAIFMHAWSAPGNSTIGCTAMEKTRVKALLNWLDASKAPVLLQIPRVLIPILRLPVEIEAFLGK